MFAVDSRVEARYAITAWIPPYNATRAHSSIGRFPPIDWEIRYRLEALKAV